MSYKILLASVIGIVGVCISAFAYDVNMDLTNQGPDAYEVPEHR